MLVVDDGDVLSEDVTSEETSLPLDDVLDHRIGRQAMAGRMGAEPDAMAEDVRRQILCDEIAIMDGGRIIAQGAPRQLVREHFDLRPAAIIRDLDLLRPIFQKTAAYGHFGREDANFTWERTDKADALRADLLVDSLLPLARDLPVEIRPAATWSQRPFIKLRASSL